MTRATPQFQILRLASLCLFVMVTVACSGDASTPILTATPLPTATYTASPQPTLTATQTPTPTATATFTSTPEPTQTLTETPTSTPSPTPFILSIVSDQAAIYSGPGEAYELLAIYAGGLNMYSVGRSEDNNWLIVNLPDKPGWVSIQHVNTEFEINVLPIEEIPPTPVPSITPTPSPSIVHFIEPEKYTLKDIHNFEISNFQPWENFLIEIISAETGKIVWRDLGNVKGNGGITRVLRFHEKSEYPNGKYYFRVTGDQGSYAEVSFSINNPD